MSKNKEKSKKKTPTTDENNPWAATQKVMMFLKNKEVFDASDVEEIFALDYPCYVNKDMYKAEALKCLENGYQWLSRYWCDRFLQSTLDRMWCNTFDWLQKGRGDRGASSAADIAVKSMTDEFTSKWD